MNLFDEMSTCEHCGADTVNPLQAMVMGALSGVAAVAAGKAVQFAFKTAVNAKTNTVDLNVVD